MSKTWMTGALVLGIMVAGASRLPAEDNDGNGRNVAVVREWTGFHSTQEVPRRGVVTNQRDWEAVWSIMHGGVEPKPETPAIDFAGHMVIAVFMGERATGGYRTRITKIEDHDKRVVSVQESRPPPDAMTIQALTSPYHVVVVPKTDKAVEFVRLADAAELEPHETFTATFVVVP